MHSTKETMHNSLITGLCGSADYDALYALVCSQAGDGYAIAHSRKDVVSVYDLEVDNRAKRFSSIPAVVLSVIYSLDAQGFLAIEAVRAKQNPTNAKVESYNKEEWQLAKDASDDPHQRQFKRLKHKGKTPGAFGSTTRKQQP